MFRNITVAFFPLPSARRCSISGSEQTQTASPVSPPRGQALPFPGRIPNQPQSHPLPPAGSTGAPARTAPRSACRAMPQRAGEVLLRPFHRTMKAGKDLQDLVRPSPFHRYHPLNRVPRHHHLNNTSGNPPACLAQGATGTSRRFPSFRPVLRRGHLKPFLY